jgi:hypothetical protein
MPFYQRELLARAIGQLWTRAKIPRQLWDNLEKPEDIQEK